MLVRFVVSNFLSFKEETEFNTLTGAFKLHKHHLIPSIKNLEILKIASIYGANGAGKSNFVLAIDFLTNLILKETKDKEKVYTNKFKLDSSYKNKPTEFEIELIVNNSLYVYNIKIQDNIIANESLYKVNSIANQSEDLIFERTTDSSRKTKINIHDKYTKTSKDKLLFQLYEEDLLLPNQAFLQVFKGKKIKEINEVYNWFDKKLSLIYLGSKYPPLIHRIKNDPLFNEYANKIVKGLNTGVVEISTEEIPIDSIFGNEEKETKEKIINDLSEKNFFTLVSNEGKEFILTLNANKQASAYKLICKHNAVNDEQINFDIMEESDGTKRLIELLPVFVGLNLNDSVFIIDEIERSMHPHMIKQLIELFLSNKKSKGQLIFTTHESNLLDLNLFRQDEIWFTEKNNIGATQLYPLSDYKPRFDLDIRKGYLNGRFGAIPFLGNLKDLNW